MSSKIFSGIFTRSIRVRVLVSVILFSFSLSVIAFEEWVPRVPYGSQVELSYWEEAGVSYVNVLIEFPSSGYNVSNWGTPRIDGNTISVDAEIWDWTGLDLQVITYMSNDYNLGNLSAGEYFFVFGAWESPVKSTSFTVSGGLLVDLPYLATHMEDFYGVMVKTNGIVKLSYVSIYMYEDFWLEAQTGENILVVVRFAGLPIPPEGSHIEVWGIIEYCELEGGFFYLYALSSQLLPTASFFPHEIYLDEQTSNFTVSVNIENLQASHRFTGVEFRLEYDTSVLSLAGIIEGEFPKDFEKTVFFTIEMDVPIIFILLEPPYTRFPEGNGSIIAFSFIATELPENSTVHLDIQFANDTTDDYCHIRRIWNKADLNYDGKVNVLDIPVFAKAFGTHPGQYRWNTNVDLDRNQLINIRDLYQIAKNLGQTASQQ